MEGFENKHFAFRRERTTLSVSAMDEHPFDSQCPPDEAWWERELHRREKLMDKYMSTFDLQRDWPRWSNPEDLYNKIYYGIDPAEPGADHTRDRDGASASCLEDWEHCSGSGPEMEAEADFEDPDQEVVESEGYGRLTLLAHDFADRVFELRNLPGDADVLYLSAGKITANLAGGHGLGYDEEMLCGNIVKCRWALADCRFCRELLEHWHDQTGDGALMALALDAGDLAESIAGRIEQLRARVWW
jgi:hypothetical protein